MKKKNVKSKFSFVKIDARDTEVAYEIKKVKNIIQRFLITYQWSIDQVHQYMIVFRYVNSFMHILSMNFRFLNLWIFMSFWWTSYNN